MFSKYSFVIHLLKKFSSWRYLMEQMESVRGVPPCRRLTFGFHPTFQFVWVNERFVDVFSIVVRQCHQVHGRCVSSRVLFDHRESQLLGSQSTISSGWANWPDWVVPVTKVAALSRVRDINGNMLEWMNDCSLALEVHRRSELHGVTIQIHQIAISTREQRLLHWGWTDTKSSNYIHLWIYFVFEFFFSYHCSIFSSKYFMKYYVLFVKQL